MPHTIGSCYTYNTESLITALYRNVNNMAAYLAFVGAIL